MRDVPLGTLIFRAGLLAEEQLEDALQEGMRNGKRLGEVLLERGWLHERDLGRLLAGQKGLPFVEIRASDAEPAALQLLPEEKARLQIALPLRFEGGQLVVAVADPSNELVLENLRRSLGSAPRLVVAPQGELVRAIGEAYTGVVATQEPTITPEPTLAPEPTPQTEPVLQPESILASEPILAPEPTFQPEQPAPAPVPLPTVLPPAEARDAQPASAPPLQPPVVEPAAFVVEQPPAVEPTTLPAPTVDETPAPPLAQPALQPEPIVVPEPVTSLVEPSVEAQPAPPEPLTPIAPPQPPIQVEVTEPQPTPEPPLAPTAAEQPLQAAPVPLEQITAPLPPAGPVEAPVASQPEEESGSLHVVLLRLRDGEAVEVGTFTTAIEASARAQELVRQIATAEGDAGWPFFGERYLRPDAIVSVDLLEESADKWLGSAERTRWANEESA